MAESTTHGRNGINWCDICDVRLPSAVSSRVEHKNGRSHKSKVNALKGSADKSPSNALKRSLEISLHDAKSVGDESSRKQTKLQDPGDVSVVEKAESEAADSDFTCEVCDKVFSSSLIALQHFKGKEHTANILSSLQSQSQKSNVGCAEGLANKSSANTLNKSVKITSPDTKAVAKESSNNESKKESLVSENKANVSDPDLWCGVCHNVFKNKENALRHFQKKSHAEMVKKRGEMPKPRLSCDVCNVTNATDEHALLHFKSKGHIAKVTAKAIKQQQIQQIRQQQYNTKRGRGQGRGSSTGASTNRFQPFQGSENKSIGNRNSPYNFSNTQYNSGSSFSNSVPNGSYKNFDNDSSGSMYMNGTDPTLAHISSVSNDIIHLKTMLREYEY